MSTVVSRSEVFARSTVVDGLIAQGMTHLCDAVGSFARARDLTNITQTKETLEAVLTALVKTYARTPEHYTGMMLMETETIIEEMRKAAGR
jgi:hypothetical protein